MTRMQKTWLWIGLVIIIIGFVNLYVTPSLLWKYQEETFFEDVTDISNEAEEIFYRECYEKHCRPLEYEYGRQCEKLRLKCAEEHMFAFDKCKDDLLKYCNTSAVDNCSLTCKKEWEAEKAIRIARKNAMKAVASTTLQKEEVDLSLGHRVIRQPSINMYSLPEYSLRFMINPEKPSTTWRTILFNTNANGNDRVPAIWLYPGTEPRLHIRHSSRINQYGVPIESRVGDMKYNQWSHVILVVGDSRIKLYINGQLVNVQALSSGDTFTWGSVNQKLMYLRHPLSNEVHYGKTLVKEIDWYSKALTDEEVMQIFAEKK